MTSNVLNFCDYLKRKNKTEEPYEEVTTSPVQATAYGGTPQPILTSHTLMLSEFDSLVFEAYTLAHIGLSEEACLNLEKAIQRISYTDLAD